MPVALKNRSLWLFVSLYALSLGVLAAHRQALDDALAVLLVFGLGLPAVALHGLIDAAANTASFMDTWKL